MPDLENFHVLLALYKQLQSVKPQLCSLFYIPDSLGSSNFFTFMILGLRTIRV